MELPEEHIEKVLEELLEKLLKGFSGELPQIRPEELLKDLRKKGNPALTPGGTLTGIFERTPTRASG